MFTGNLCHRLRPTVRLAVVQTLRQGHTMRGKPAGEARTLAQRLRDDNPVDAELTQKVDIGFPQLRPPRSQQTKERLAHVKAQRTNAELEKQARAHTLEIDLDAVKRDWLTTSGQFHIRDLAHHFGIFQHLFGDAYFVPRVPLDIQFQLADDVLAPVYYGNTIRPSDAQQAPLVRFDSSVNIPGNEAGDSLWTLVLTNPDGHLEQAGKEYVHWFIANIPGGNDVLKGDQIVPYLQPIPAKGTGYHRHVFVLYKQNAKLDLSQYAVKEVNDLNARTFSTLDFYRAHQDELTPAGLAFFQSNWDSSLTAFYHTQLGRKEPVYEYDFPQQYRKDQTWFPLREPFNLYMDKYRDQKQVDKEFLVRRLAKSDPFAGPEPPLQFPNAHSIKGKPSWLKTEIRKARLGWGRVNDV